jgi:hypothetical protein
MLELQPPAKRGLVCRRPIRFSRHLYGLAPDWTDHRLPRRRLRDNLALCIRDLPASTR